MKLELGVMMIICWCDCVFTTIGIIIASYECIWLCSPCWEVLLPPYFYLSLGKGFWGQSARNPIPHRRNTGWQLPWQEKNCAKSSCCHFVTLFMMLETSSKMLLIPLFILFCISETACQYCVRVGPGCVISVLRLSDCIETCLTAEGSRNCMHVHWMAGGDHFRQGIFPRLNITSMLPIWPSPVQQMTKFVE